MNLYDQLVELERDARLAIIPEHMDRLILIAWDIGQAYTPDMNFLYKLQMLEDYFERWGVCYDRFWSVFDMCMKIVGPARAEYTGETDENDDVSSPV